MEKSIEKNKLDSILMSWLDTLELRQEKFNRTEELYIILSGEGYSGLKPDYKFALEQYAIKTIDFSDKATIKKEFAQII